MIGVVVRQDRTGLGYQSRALARMLKADKTLEVKDGEDIPSFDSYQQFLKDLDCMITAETPYVYEVWNWAKMAGVRTYCQPNWELFDGLIQPNMPHPDVYLMPSYWHLEEMQELFPQTIYLPPPTIASDFDEVRAINLKRTGKRRFVHIVGRPAIYDRNGWSNLMDALSYTKSDFELVVYAQAPITGLSDPRVKYHIFDQEDQIDLYKDFDALILPRRYGGLCLPMNEALMAGLPVIMPDISPNNRVLPESWLLPAYVSDYFEGRSRIDVYSIEAKLLAEKIDELCRLPNHKLRTMKQRAFKIGYDNYSDTVLNSKYKQILEK